MAIHRTTWFWKAGRGDMLAAQNSTQHKFTTSWIPEIAGTSCRGSISKKNYSKIYIPNLPKYEEEFEKNRVELFKIWKRDYLSSPKIPPYLIFECLIGRLKGRLHGSTIERKNNHLKRLFDAESKYQKDSIQFRTIITKQ